MLWKGVEGELLALTYLKSKGYDIVTTNYRAGRNEIDIIARIDRFLVFVEVKTRSSLKFGNPEDMVSADQENRIREAAENYIFTENWKGNIRFDIIAIHGSNGNNIFHIRDAF